MTVHGPHGDASTVCKQGILSAKHKGKSGISTQETPHVLGEKQKKLLYTCYSAPNSLDDLIILNDVGKHCAELWKKMV